jgi:hypothetical protein
MNLHEDIHRIKEVMGVLSEQDIDQQYDFYKTTYKPEDKTIVGAYMITGEDEKTIDVLNIKETHPENKFYMDGAKVYYLNVKKIRLPKSQIEILSNVEDKEGFNFIKIPYWLYKKLEFDLGVERLEGKKRLDITAKQSKDKNFLEQISNPNVERYLSVVNPDKSGMDMLKYTILRGEKYMD